MDDITQQWLERADYDLETARALLKSCRYLYVAFMCQQCLEKYLKASIAIQGQAPPFIHNLPKLAQASPLMENMSAAFRNLLADVNPFYIKARYGEYKASLSKICDRKLASHFFKKTGEFVVWLKARLKSSSQ